MESNITESYRVFLATKTAFPTDRESADTIAQEIKRLCKESDIGFKSAMVERYLARVKVGPLRTSERYAIKTLIEPLIADIYGVSEETKKTRVAFKVEALLGNSSFCYADPEKAKGLYENRIFPVVIARRWFAETGSTTALGLALRDAYRSKFNPIPLPLVAFVAAMIDDVLREWETGRHVDTQSRNNKKPKLREQAFSHHLRELEKYERRDPSAFVKWRDDLQKRIEDIDTDNADL